MVAEHCIQCTVHTYKRKCNFKNLQKGCANCCLCFLYLIQCLLLLMKYDRCTILLPHCETKYQICANAIAGCIRITANYHYICLSTRLSKQNICMYSYLQHNFCSTQGVCKISFGRITLAIYKFFVWQNTRHSKHHMTNFSLLTQVRHFQWTWGTGAQLNI